jgi:hypothetical protein
MGCIRKICAQAVLALSVLLTSTAMLLTSAAVTPLPTSAQTTGDPFKWCKGATNPRDVYVALNWAQAGLTHMQIQHTGMVAHMARVTGRSPGRRIGTQTAQAWAASYLALGVRIARQRALIDCLSKKLTDMLFGRPIRPGGQNITLTRGQDTTVHDLRRRLKVLRDRVNRLGTDHGNIGTVGDRKNGPIGVYGNPTCKAASAKVLNLLLRNPRGREAFPGDVFYCHSRLLERSVKDTGITLKVDPSVTPDGHVKLSIAPDNIATRAELPRDHVFIGGQNPFRGQSLRRILLSSIKGAAITTAKIPNPNDKNRSQTGLKKSPNSWNQRGTKIWDGANGPTADTKPGDVGGTLKIDFSRTFGPNIDVGRVAGGGPLHRFRNNFNGFDASYRLWWLPKWPFGGFRPRLGAEIFGGVFGNTERKANTSGPGFITFINGSNAALTAIARTQNTRLRLDGHNIGGRLTSVWDRRMRAGKIMVGLLLGAMIAHSSYNYDYSTQVSAAAVGGLFTYNLSLRMRTLFAGAVIGGYLTWKLTDALSMTFRGEVAPGYQNYSLTARQTGTALPPGARVTGSLNGFAFRALMGMALHYDLTTRLRLSGMVSGTYDSAMPSILYPLAGGVALAAARHGGWKMKVGMLLVWKFGLGY